MRISVKAISFVHAYCLDDKIYHYFVQLKDGTSRDYYKSNGFRIDENHVFPVGDMPKSIVKFLFSCNGKITCSADNIGYKEIEWRK